MPRVVYFETQEEWKDWRRGRIGGSDAPIIMEASKFNTVENLWAEKSGLTNGPGMNYWQHQWAERGKELEALALTEYEKMTGIWIRPMRVFIEHTKHKFMGASLDGLSEKGDRVVQVKCPGKKDHLEARCGRIPKKYIWQCIHELFVSGAKTHDYVSFDGKQIAKPITIKRGDLRIEEMILKLIQKESAFWSFVSRHIPIVRPRAKGLFRVRQR